MRCDGVAGLEGKVRRDGRDGRDGREECLWCLMGCGRDGSVLMKFCSIFELE